jgi:hypothetical protein
MLWEPHIAPLTAYVATLRDRGMSEVPDFDPLDSGKDARVLFLFEKPGPKTSEVGGGSGFISRNNDDPTAEATFRFMQEANIPRRFCQHSRHRHRKEQLLDIVGPSLSSFLRAERTIRNMIAPKWSLARMLTEPLLQVRCAVYNGTLGAEFGQKFHPANDSFPPTAVAA